LSKVLKPAKPQQAAKKSLDPLEFYFEKKIESSFCPHGAAGKQCGKDHIRTDDVNGRSLHVLPASSAKGLPIRDGKVIACTAWPVPFAIGVDSLRVITNLRSVWRIDIDNRRKPTFLNKGDTVKRLTAGQELMLRAA
jgi:hypothetical protein